MIAVEWGRGPCRQQIEEKQLDPLLDRIASEASRSGKPQDVQVTVEGAGTLGIVLGADWSLLNHVPSNLKPPYMCCVGSIDSEEPMVFYVAGDHYSETLRRNAISREAARDAMRHFVTRRELSPDVSWEEV